MEFLDTELEVEKSTNYKFITDLLILINENILVNIELCRYYYNNHKERLCAHVYKLSSLDIKKGSDLKKDLKNIKQIVFACREKEEIKEHKSFNLCEVETREVLSNNLEINVHYLELHKKMYYNNNEVKKENLWFALFASNSLIEANEILKKLVSDNIRYKFIWSVYKMCNDDKIIADFGAEDYNNWCIEKLKEDYNELKENNEKIKEDYNEIKEDYNELKENNEKIKEDYNEIKELENNC